KPGMDLVVVGAAAGQFPWNFYALPYEVSLTTSFWGTLPELHEVIALARQGRIKAHIQRFPLEGANHAYELMEHGQLDGRAVMVSWAAWPGAAGMTSGEAPSAPGAQSEAMLPVVAERRSDLPTPARQSLADGVIALTLADPEGARLPAWTP